MTEEKQGILGAVNNAIIDQLKTRLPNPDPDAFENKNIVKHVTDHSVTTLAERYSGDAGSKADALVTLEDLTSIINNRITAENKRNPEKNLVLVSTQEIAKVTDAAWEAALAKYAKPVMATEQQQKVEKPADTWSEELLKKQQPLYPQR